MPIFAFGLNHTTAPLDLRERISLSFDSIPGALHELLGVQGINEAAIVSTCNRMDLYCELNEDSSERAIDWFRAYHSLKPVDILPYLYQHRSAQAVRHLLRVASGLDSLVLGEPQILGQIKDAHRIAQNAGTIGRVLDRLFQRSFATAKKIRTTTALGTGPVSVAYAGVSLAKRIFGDLSEATALMLGAGETVELACRHLTKESIGQLIIANRTVTKARHLATRFGGFAIPLDELDHHLTQTDIMVCSTGSPKAIVGYEAIATAIKRRKHRPMFIVDLALPRDVESKCGELDDVYLYNIDDLEGIVSAGQLFRSQAAQVAEQLIEGQVDEVMGRLDALGASKLVRAYRAQAGAVRDEVLSRANRRLHKGQAPEVVLNYLANTLTNKLLHTPTSALRNAAQEGRSEILDTAIEVLGVQDSPNLGLKGNDSS